MPTLQQTRPILRIGMGGWQLEPFNKIFYPFPVRKGFRKLEHYSRYFDTVEVNATYHSNALTSKNAQQWIQDVSANAQFSFSVKLFKGFTHTMDAREGDVTVVSNLVGTLAEQEKLTALVMQFPYSFRNTGENRSHLKKLAKAFGAFPMFVEVRHDSWNTAEVLAFLQDQHLHRINVDLPEMKNHMPLTNVAWGGRSYFRLMGRNAVSWGLSMSKRGQLSASESGRYLYRYSEKELEELAGLIRPISIKMNETEVILHNDPLGNSLLNGLQLKHLMNPKERIEAPPNLVKKFPELQAICVTTNDGGTNLFGS